MTPTTQAATLRAKADTLQRLRHWLIRIEYNTAAPVALRDVACELEWRALQIEDDYEHRAEELDPWPVFTLRQLDLGKTALVFKEDRT
jgi:hypothetical protein